MRIQKARSDKTGPGEVFKQRDRIDLLSFRWRGERAPMEQYVVVNATEKEIKSLNDFCAKMNEENHDFDIGVMDNYISKHFQIANCKEHSFWFGPRK